MVFEEGKRKFKPTVIVANADRRLLVEDSPQYASIAVCTTQYSNRVACNMSKSALVKELREREDESIKLRKKILKTSYSTSNIADVMANIAQDCDQSAARLATLNKFKKKSKTITEGQIAKLEWLKEQGSLQGLGQSLDKDIAGLLEVMLLHNITDSNVQELVSLNEELTTSRVDNERLIISQLKEIKGMMNEAIKSVKKIEKRQIANEEYKQMNDNLGSITDSNTCSGKSALCNHPSVSIVADVMMQVRANHNHSWRGLKAAETSLHEAILQDRRSIINALRNDKLLEQNEKIKHEFLLRDDDDMEVEMFMEEWINKLNVLDDAHRTELKLLKKERLNAAENCGLSNNNSADEDGPTTTNTIVENNILAARGGWSEDDHDVFTKIYRQAQMNGIPRSTLSANLAKNLPHKTNEELATHEQWYRAVRMISNKKNDLIVRYTVTREALIKEAKEQLDKLREHRRLEHIRENEIKRHEEGRMELHDKLTELRRQRKIMEDKLAEEERIRLLEEVNRERLVANAMKAEQEDRKMRVEMYKRARDQLAQVQQRLEEERKRIENESIKKEVEENKWKIEMREQLRLEKEDEKRRKEEELRLKECRRMEWLSKLAEQVPYWEAMQNAQSKLDHITASAKAWEYIGVDDPGRGYLPLNGFADIRVLRDARVRLAMALREAGVSHTIAAKEVVQQFHPRPQLAIHGLL